MSILTKLHGGDLRSKGRSEEVVADVLKNKQLFGELFQGFYNANPVVRMRVADAVEKISRQLPELLESYKQKLIEEVSCIPQQEVQWHLAQVFGRIDFDKKEIKLVSSILQSYFRNSSSNIAKVMSLQAMFDLSQKFPELTPEVQQMLHEALALKVPSLISRARKLDKSSL
jgi:hypothetical protein